MLTWTPAAERHMDATFPWPSINGPCMDRTDPKKVHSLSRLRVRRREASLHGASPLRTDHLTSANGVQELENSRSCRYEPIDRRQYHRRPFSRECTGILPPGCEILQPDHELLNAASAKFRETSWPGRGSCQQARAFFSTGHR